MFHQELTIDTLSEKVKTLQSKRHAFPAELRLQLFKMALKKNAEHAEKVASKLVRMMFDYDLSYFVNAVKGWKEESKVAQKESTLKNIVDFMAIQKLADEMTFQQHAYYCFCLCALASGIEIKDLDAEYDKQLHVMVAGTIHPSGKWSVKEEFENQYYAKYIVHVSKTGLASLPTINRMASMRADEDVPDSKYWSIRLVAAACGDKPSFDGIETCTAVDVFNHDLIHTGFEKYAIMHDKERFWSCVKKIGKMYDFILNDPDLLADPQKKAVVQIAFFLFTHELTTSSAVHGFPRRLPKQHWLLGGLFASAPQMALRWTAKFHLIQEVFSNEIKNEQMLLQTMGIDLRGLKDASMTDHEKVKEIMEKINPGYAYLNEKFGDLYGHQHWFSAFLRRCCYNRENMVTNFIKNTFGYE